MKTIASDGYILRPIEGKDSLRWAEIFIDWPRDKRGGRSIARGIGEADYNLKHKDDVGIPLTDQSSGEIVRMYCTPDDLAIGAYRVSCAGKDLTILNYGVHPDWRGKGLSSTMTHQWTWFAQLVLEADRTFYDVFEDQPGALANAAKFSSLQSGKRTGETGINLIPSQSDRADADRQRAAASNLITYEVITV